MLRRRFGLATGVAIMLALSIGLLLWQAYGMERVLRIDAASPFKTEVADDRLNDGNSIATFQTNGSQYLLGCLVKPGYQWPYCELDVYLAKAPQGIDLRVYDEVALKLSYTGVGQHRVRFYLRNFHPDYSKTDSTYTWKLNEVQFVADNTQEIRIPLQKFDVASWWAGEFNLPLKHYGKDISNVPMMIVSTAGQPEYGVHQLRIDYIEFRGKWLTRERLALGLLALWALFGVGLMLMRFVQLRHRLQLTQQEAASLIETHAVLHLENERVEDLAKLDPLTGVRNRAGIRDEVALEIQRSTADAPLAAVMCDIDHFKHINDEYGHPMGDEVLVAFARLLREHVRHGDFVVRWGGEEFVLFLPNTPQAQAVIIAEKLRVTIEQYSWPHKETVTASFGVSTLRAEGLSQLMQRVDDALYQAKRQGRNQVIAL